MKSLKRIMFLFLFTGLVSAAFGEESIQLTQNWKARQASFVTVDGAVLTSGNQDFKDWMPAIVPGTVLNTLVSNGQFPDPKYGMNNNLIPDIYDTGNQFYTYWFVCQFDYPGLADGQHLWLNFRGINYRADVFLNGKRITTTQHEGMFIRRSYDVTDAVKAGSNTLAVLVLPPDIPGRDNVGQAGDGMIARNNTMQCTAGWDWIAAVRDRNTGIWDQVTLTTTGSIRLMHPQVISHVPGIRLPEGKQADASLDVNVEVENLTAQPQDATISYTVENQSKSLKIKLTPFEKAVVKLPAMTIKNPKLWWPNNMGAHDLYNLRMTVSDGKPAVSDQKDVRFGIREITTKKDPATGGREFYVNGQKVFVRGGNYISSDWLLRFNAERYKTEIHYLADMNLNMLRVWGGAVPERPEFYNACDAYGMLVFQDLAVSGDGNGAWYDPKKLESQERRQQYPDNHQLFVESVIDEVKMLRNHPSLAIWCGGNEWPAPKDIADVLHAKVFPENDPTRYLAPYSTDTTFTRNVMGGNGDGPYNIQEPEYFFTFRSSPFNPELGSVGVPEPAALKSFMDPKDYADFPRKGQPINPVWDYHKYIPYGDFIYRYADPKTTEEFCEIAQLLNFEQYRALMEGWASKMWDWYTGMIIWKIQNPWTALRGQMYDCDLDVNACYYGVKSGGEPVHIQYNPVSKHLEAVNTTLSDQNGCTVRARIYQLDGKMIGEQVQQAVLLKANSEKDLFAVNQPNLNGAYFLRLDLMKGSEVLSENTYWLTTKPKDYTSLKSMPASGATVSASMQKLTGNEYKAVIDVKSGSGISFFNHVAVFNKKTGERILPVFYSDNYFTVFPNEEKKVNLSFATHVPQQDIQIVINNWNDRK